MVTLNFVLTIEHTKLFRHHWHGDIEIWSQLHGDPSWKYMRTGVWASCFWLNELRWPFYIAGLEIRDEDCEVEVWCGILPPLAKCRGVFATFSERMEKFFFHGHGNNLKQIENKPHVQMSFRCVWQFAVSFCGDCIASFKFGMSENIRSEMHACERIFHLKESLVQSRNKAETVTARETRQTVVSLLVRWSKSRAVSDRQCVWVEGFVLGFSGCFRPCCRPRVSRCVA